MVVMALGQSASPRLAQFYINEDKRAFQWLLVKLVLIGGLLTNGATSQAELSD
jgi:hypothetical protein